MRRRRPAAAFFRSLERASERRPIFPLRRRLLGWTSLCGYCVTRVNVLLLLPKTS